MPRVMRSSSRAAPFTFDEIELVVGMFKAGALDREIIGALNDLPANAGQPRNATQLYKLRRELRLVSNKAQRQRAIDEANRLNPHSPATRGVTHEEAVEGDHAFKRAVLAAIKAGTESAVLGVIKDRRPIKALRFERAPMSYGASPAAACADLG